MTWHISQVTSASHSVAPPTIFFVFTSFSSHSKEIQNLFVVDYLCAYVKLLPSTFTVQSYVSNSSNSGRQWIQLGQLVGSPAGFLMVEGEGLNTGQFFLHEF